MAPLVILVVVTVVARTAGAFGLGYVASWPAAMALGLSAMFIVSGAAHFIQPRRAGLVAIVPPPFKHPAALVTVTGVLELLGAVALLLPAELGPLRTTAASGLALLLVAMFPANVYAAKSQRSEHSPSTPLARRFAMQCVFIAATLFVAIAS